MNYLEQAQQNIKDISGFWFGQDGNTTEFVEPKQEDEDEQS